MENFISYTYYNFSTLFLNVAVLSSIVTIVLKMFIFPIFDKASVPFLSQSFNYLLQRPGILRYRRALSDEIDKNIERVRNSADDVEENGKKCLPSSIRIEDKVWNSQYPKFLEILTPEERRQVERIYDHFKQISENYRQLAKYQSKLSLEIFKSKIEKKQLSSRDRLLQGLLIPNQKNQLQKDFVSVLEMGNPLEKSRLNLSKA